MLTACLLFCPIAIAATELPQGEAPLPTAPPSPEEIDSTPIEDAIIYFAPEPAEEQAPAPGSGVLRPKRQDVTTPPKTPYIMKHEELLTALLFGLSAALAVLALGTLGGRSGRGKSKLHAELTKRL